MEEEDINHSSVNDKVDKTKPKPSSADSGVSNEDFSLMSNGSSDFSLLEASSDKESGKDQPKSESKYKLNHDSTEISDAVAQNDKNTIKNNDVPKLEERKRIVSTASSTGNDFSILDMTEDSSLNVTDLEEDSGAVNNLELLKIIHPVTPAGPNDSSPGAGSGQLISMSRPQQSINQSSELGSSFAVIDPLSMSSSYPSSFDKPIDRSKIEILPPKGCSEAQLSTSIDGSGENIPKKKSLHGGVVEIGHTDLTTKESVDSLDTGEMEEVIKSTKVDSSNSHDETKLQDTEKSIVGVKVTNDATMMERNDTVNNHSMKTDVDDTEGKRIDSRDKSLKSEDVSEEDRKASEFQILKEQEDMNTVAKDKSQSNKQKDQNNVDKNEDFSLVDISEKEEENVSRHTPGKSDSDSNTTEPKSRSSSSSGSIEIQMNEPEIETSDESTGSKNRSDSETSASYVSSGNEEQTSGGHVSSGYEQLKQQLMEPIVKIEESGESKFGHSEDDRDMDLQTNEMTPKVYPAENFKEKVTSLKADKMNAEELERSNVEKFDSNMDKKSSNYMSYDDCSLSFHRSDNLTDDEMKTEYHTKTELNIEDSIKTGGDNVINGEEEIISRSCDFGVVEGQAVQLGINEQNISEDHKSKDTQNMAEDVSLESDRRKDFKDSLSGVNLEQDKMEDQAVKISPAGNEGKWKKNEMEMANENVLQDEAYVMIEHEDGPKSSADKDFKSDGDSNGETTPQSNSSDVWPSTDYDRDLTKEEERQSESLRRDHGLQMVKNFQHSKKHKSYEADIEVIEIPTENELISAKWRYVLTKKDKLDPILNERCPGTSLNFDVSFEKLELIKYGMVESEEEVKKWSSAVVEVIQNEVRKINSYLICCSQEDVKTICSLLDKYCSSENLDVDVFNQEAENDGKIIVTGFSRDAAKLVMQLDSSSVQLFESQEEKIVAMSLCSWSLNREQLDFFVINEGPRAIRTQFPNSHVQVDETEITMLVQYKDLEKVKSFANDKWLRFKHASKMSLKPMEFTLILKECVKDYIINSKLIYLGFDYHWRFIPLEQNVILYTESQQQGDEIRDAIFSSFSEHLIKLQNLSEPQDVEKLEKWKEIVEDVSNRSKGMAEISINDDQTEVLITGTDDLMSSWQVYGDIVAIEKHIDHNIKPIVKSQVKKSVPMEAHRKDNISKEKMDQLQQNCSSMDVNISMSDIGFEVIGSDESKVEDICDRLQQLSLEPESSNREIVKRFVQMSEEKVVMIQNEKLTEILNYGKKLDVEFDPTNLGFEVRGKLECNVRKFCDYLSELEDLPSEIITKFVKVEKDVIAIILEQNIDEIDAHGKELDVDFESTGAGFEVKGRVESKINQFCDLLLQLGEKAKTEHEIVKLFVQMEEWEVDLLLKHKFGDMEKYGKELHVEFDPTNLGFEVKGTKKSNVKTFCDFLSELKTKVAREELPETKSGGEKAQTGTDDVLGLPKVKRFVQQEKCIVEFIEKWKKVELEEIMTNIEVELFPTDLGFEVSGNNELDVQTVCSQLISINWQLESRKIQTQSTLTDGDIQKLEKKYKCIIKVLKNIGEVPVDVEVLNDVEVWKVNDIKISVVVSDGDGLSCDVFVVPKEEGQGKKFCYQEKLNSEEVQMWTPDYSQDGGKEKHALTDLFTELLLELNNKPYSVIALPVSNFKGWPPVKLTKIFLVALEAFLKKKLNQYDIQNIVLYAKDRSRCTRLVSAIENAMQRFKTAGFIVAHVKKMEVLNETNFSETPSEPLPLPHTDTNDSSLEKQDKDATGKKLPPHIKIKPEIIVLKGQIAEQEVDVIVNITSPDFNLNNGAVSKTILKGAGKNIQKEIHERGTVRETHPGDVVVTAGYELKCKAVFHGALQGFDKTKDMYSQRSVEYLKKFVSNCLRQAHEKKYKSIAFPALGTGVLDFPPDLVATVMIEEVNWFRKQYPKTYLSEIRIVIYRDEGIYMVFKKFNEANMERLLKEMLPQTEDKPEIADSKEIPGHVKDTKPFNILQDLPTQGIQLALDDVLLSAGLGDVTKLEGFDCLILLWPQEEIATTPPDKAVIVSSMGPSNVEQWEVDKSTLSDSKVLVTPGGSLPHKTIIHVYVDNFRLQEAFVLGLTKAEELNMLSAVIPVRPTDQLAKDVKKFSTCIYQAVTEMKQQFRTLKHIKVCIGGRHLCQPILATLAKLQETGGELKIVQITALRDDMENIVAEINPPMVDEEELRSVDEDKIKDKTLTKDVVEHLDKHVTQFLVNISAEISPDIIEAICQRNLLDQMKQNMERVSGHVKVIENDGKWFIHASSFSHIEVCQQQLQELWESLVSENSGANRGKIVVKVNITRDLYQAMMFLEGRNITEQLGIVNIKFLEENGSIEITGQSFQKDTAQQLKKIINDFQQRIAMDVLEVPYRQLKEMSTQNWVTKLQTENPSVYIYSSEGNSAESSFSVYFVSLNQDEVKTVKKNIMTEYLKTSNRAGRFSQSQSGNKNNNGENLRRSFSHLERKPSPKTFKTAEGLEVKVYMGNILKLDVDSIVNAANGHLMHGGGVAAVIADAAGRAFNRECRDYVKSYGPVKTGECCVTNAGNLPYKRVIHGVGPQWSQRSANECCDVLQKTIEQCIQMANAHGMKSLAIPSISAGLYGMPAELCAKSYAVGVMTVSASRTGHWTLKQIHFVDNKPEMVCKVQAAFTDFFESSGTTRQRSVEEHLKSFDSLEQFRGDQNVIEKLSGFPSSLKNMSSGTTIPAAVTSLNNMSSGTTVPAPVTSYTQVGSGHFTINQNQMPLDALPHNTDLPISWKVVIKRNLIEIIPNHGFKVFIYEQDFGKLVIESIAIGQDMDYERKSCLVRSLMSSRPIIKSKLGQLRVQLSNPIVGTVAMFEAITDLYVQNVFVVFMPRYPKNGDLSEKKKFHDDLYRCYLKLFTEAANTRDVEFLAVSFLKTGNKGTAFEDGANVFLQAVNTFTVKQEPNCQLKQIHLVVNKSTSALKTIKTVLEQNLGSRGRVEHKDEKVDKKTLAMVCCKTTNQETPQEQKKDIEDNQEKTTLTGEQPTPVECAICLDVISDDNKKVLDKCKHEFCNDCITECFKHKPVCPSCGTVYGVVLGNQPPGTMRVEHKPTVHLPGYKKCGHWYIHYQFSNGKQTSEHPNPGHQYRGTYRSAYLPDNEKGTLVMKLLKIAFDRRLVFTIGHSRTTGEENVVTWNDIHHKTSMQGGAQGFGYPDPEYLDRVLDELAAKGVTKEDLKQRH